jgi:hypothetical protein
MKLNLLDPKFIVLAAVVILVIAVLAWVYVRKRRSTTASLRQKFGPEYERAVQKHGSERKAQAKLADRQERVEKLKIRDLDPTERERFSKQWESVQSRFVDSPKGAVVEADDLVSSLIGRRRTSKSGRPSKCLEDSRLDRRGGAAQSVSSAFPVFNLIK